MITNGWSYLMLGIGLLTRIKWMIAVASAYLAILWIPFSPEKVVTVAIALFLVRRLFPKHNEFLRQQIMQAAGQEEKKGKGSKKAKTPLASDSASPDSTAPTPKE